MRFYIDTCVFLNVWKKEVGPNPAQPFWEKSLLFLHKHKGHILISSAVLQELGQPTEGRKRIDALLEAHAITRVNTDGQLMALAETLAEKEKSISFLDAIHLLVAKREGATLVTRDKNLLKVATREGVCCGTPEQFISC